jgi:deoxyribodipyrimidine photo-lyase
MTITPASPTHGAATARIAAIRPAAYARTRNHIEGAVTGLSPWITHGVVTLREVLAAVLAREPLTADHKLVYEFGWREYFRHVWAHEGEGILRSLHAGLLDEAHYSPVLPEDIREARSGVPVIDQAVRTLYATGTLHNHARMWLASYVVHLRKVHWRAGADWMVAHLLDGDLASNHLSWQWVAGTASHKPYLFNAENVARFAPAQWHSPGTCIDCSYEELERVARSRQAVGGVAGPAPDASPVGAGHARDTSPVGAGHARDNSPAKTTHATEPPLLAHPPEDLGLAAPDVAAPDLQGRTVWLVHPWALRAPPANLPPDAVVIGIYPREHHAQWPWPEARWRWVDAAMAELTPERWWVDAAHLPALLSGAATVRSIDDPHISQWLRQVAEPDTAPALFPLVERRCTSFSQWWSRATRGLKNAEDLL